MKTVRMTLNELLRTRAGAGKRRTALIYLHHPIAYSTLLEEVERIAAGLQRLGLRKGQRVALLLPNCPQFVIAYFAVLRAGGIVTPTSPIYTAREASHQWQDSGAVIVFADRALAATVAPALESCPDIRHVVWTEAADYGAARHAKLRRPPAKRRRILPSPETPGKVTHLEWTALFHLRRRPSPVNVRPGDVACLQYTGGTTGTSKGAMLTHANLVTNADQTSCWLTGGRGGRETFIAALPLFHIYATTCVMISGIFCGGTVVILPRFELESVLRTVRRYRPTIFHGVPTMYVALNGVPDIRKWGFHHLRICMSGGAPLPPSVQQRFESLTGASLVEGYGLTESSPVTHVNPPGRTRSGSIGMLISGTRARIVDMDKGDREMPIDEPGELTIRGPQVMKGYWRKPEETARVLRGGWLYTGDVARHDEEGYYYIVDRKKDLILAGGFNVYPREVEEVLFEHPDIREAAVIGVPDEYRGETVKAFVVPKPGASPAPDAIIRFCRERLAAYKVPRQVEFRDSIPKSGVGKYLRRELRKPN